MSIQGLKPAQDLPVEKRPVIRVTPRALMWLPPQGPRFWLGSRV